MPNPSQELTTPAPKPGRRLKGDTASFRGRSRPGGARRSPGFGFAFVPFPWSPSNHAVVPWPPPGSLFLSARQAERGGAEWLGSGGDCRALWNLAGQILGVEKARQRAPPGRSEEGLTCQESLIAALAPQLRPSLGHTRAFRDHLGQLPPVTKGSAAA